MDKVAGFLEVDRHEDAWHIVIKVPGLKPDASDVASGRRIRIEIRSSMDRRK